MITTIRLHEAVKKELDRLKIHPREPYEEVIKKLILRGNKKSLKEKKVRKL